MHKFRDCFLLKICANLLLTNWLTMWYNFFGLRRSHSVIAFSPKSTKRQALIRAAFSFECIIKIRSKNVALGASVPKTDQLTVASTIARFLELSSIDLIFLDFLLFLFHQQNLSLLRLIIQKLKQTVKPNSMLTVLRWTFSTFSLFPFLLFYFLFIYLL